MESTTTEKLTLSVYLDSLHQYKESLKNAGDLDGLRLHIFQQFQELIDLYLELGDYVLSLDGENKDQNTQAQQYLIHYVVPEDLKSLCILQRDVLLEVNKVLIMDKEWEFDESRKQDFLNRSIEVLSKAAEELNNEVLREEKALGSRKRLRQFLHKRLILQDNPWLVYKKQFEALKEQFEQIDGTRNQLLRVKSIFIHIKEIVSHLQNQTNQLTDRFEKSSLHLKTLIEKEEKSSQINSHIDDTLKIGLTAGNVQTAIADEMINYTNQLTSMSIPVGSIDSMIKIREVNLKRATQKWLDYEILPLILDVIALEERLKSTCQFRFSNIKSSIQFSKSTQDKLEHKVLSEFIDDLLKEIEIISKLSAELLMEINERLHKKFRVANLFQNRPFLEIPVQSSFYLDRGLQTKLKNRVSDILEAVKGWYSRSAYNHNLTALELASNCIVQRMKQESDHYDKLFLGKNFIGDLFIVPRTKHDSKLKEVLDQWNQGFHKAVLVIGDPLSGKTTFLEYSSKKHFGKQVVMLLPNSIATIDGRKFNTSFDLQEALDYVKNNNNKSTRPVLIIDDLERWHDNENPFLDNIRALMRFAESETDDIFLVVATSKIMGEHLSKRLKFFETFSVTIDVSVAESQEILHSLMTRHQTSHKVLVNDEHQLITNNKIVNAIGKLSKIHHHNLGEVLQAWTYHTTIIEYDRIVFEMENIEFPDFFSSQEDIILKQTLLYKYTSEFTLKKVTASGFELGFRAALKRLINTKVLIRNLRGMLNINPLVVNDVNRIIRNKNT